MVNIDGTEITGATIDGEAIVEITIDGEVAWVAISTLMELTSGNGTDGDTIEFSLSGNSGASSLTFTGVETTASGSASDTNSGGSFIANVGGNQSPTNESVTIEGSGSTISSSVNYYNTTYENTSFDVDGYSSPYGEGLSIEPKSEALDPLWSDNSKSFTYSVATDGNDALFGSGTTVYCVDADTGYQNWSKTLEDNSGYQEIYAAEVGPNNMYVAMRGQESYNNDIIGLDKQNGDVLWKYDPDTKYGQGIVSDGTNVAVVGRDEGVVMLDTSGDFKWDKIYDTNAASELALYNGDVFVTHGYDIYKIDNSGSSVHGLMFDSRLEGVVSIGSKIYVLEGTHIWECPTDLSSKTEIYTRSYAQSNLATDGDYLYLAEDNSDIIIVDTSGSKLYSRNFGDAYYTLDAGNNNLIALKDDTEVEMILASPGTTGVDIDIGGSSYYYSDLSSTENEYPNFSLGSNDVYINTDSGEVDVHIDWTEDHRTQDPSATIDGSTVSHNGSLASGETETANVSISSPGSYSVNTSTNGGSATFNVDWTEVTHTEDPSLTINGTTFTHNGVLSAGSTKSFTPSESLFGETTDVLDLALTDGEVDVNFDLEIQDQNSVTIDTLPNNWSSNFSDL